MNERNNLLILIANLCVLGLMLKLYTEVFKDKAFDQRAKKPLLEEHRIPTWYGVTDQS